MSARFRAAALALLFTGLIGWVGVGDAGGASFSKPDVATLSKQGIASSKYLTSDPAKLHKLNVSWAYDWSWRRPPRHTRGVQWVPMVWGAGAVTRHVISALTADRRRGRATYLLGFNEPDDASQSNMTPVQAADLWPWLESTGLQLGAPAPAVPDDGWLAHFMKLAGARHLRIDFLAVHVYQDFTNPKAVGELKRLLLSLNAKYHLPIWVTEIGTIDLRARGIYMEHAATYARAKRYMYAVTALLNSLPFVARYAWFTDDGWDTPAWRVSSLFNGRNQLTRMGRAYAQVAG
jgi:hypothetical protein